MFLCPRPPRSHGAELPPQQAAGSTVQYRNEIYIDILQTDTAAESVVVLVEVSVVSVTCRSSSQEEEEADQESLNCQSVMQQRRLL